ncbi:ATP-grasp domain-containing protein [Methanosarcinales archaeon]|nr:MAG: ATP-grasp domain-containing protein [Methanosarcinales archaeon]
MESEEREIGVVVVGDHVQALGIIRSLGMRNIPVYLLNDRNLCIGRFSRYTKKFIKTPDMGNEIEFVDFIVKLAGRKQINGWILMPTNDVAVYTLSKHKETLEEYYKVPTPCWDVTRLAYNKKLTYQIAENNNIPIPKTIYPESMDELYEILSDLDFPVIIKPAIVDRFYKKTKTKVFKANNKDELIQAYIKASHVIDPSEIMVQEVIPGGPSLLYSFCSFFKNGKVKGMLIGRRSRQRPMDFGSASTFVESIYMPELAKLGTRLLKAINYYGLSEVEFKKDVRDGEFKLLEVNARTWLWHSLAMRCGVDFPYILYKDIIGDEITPITSFTENVKWMHTYTDIGVAVKEVLKGNMSIKDYVISLKGEKVFGVFSWEDPMPFIAESLMLPYLWATR